MNKTLSDDAIRDVVFEIIARQAKLDIAMLKPELTLKDLDIESLTAVEVLFDIEEHFDFDFPGQAADIGTGTLQQLVDAVRQALDVKSGGAGSAA